MRLTEYERTAQREIDRWERGETLLQQALGFAMKPVDWAFDQFVPESVTDALTDALTQALSTLNDAERLDLRRRRRDRQGGRSGRRGRRPSPSSATGRSTSSTRSPSSTRPQNSVLAALSGGGAGLGGALLLAADIPVLFTVNFRLIQQIAAAYGFPLQGPGLHAPRGGHLQRGRLGQPRGQVATRCASWRSRRRPSTAAATGGARRRARCASSSGHVPREIAKNLGAQKLAQMIPIAGAAVGAGVNYWFTDQTAQAAVMLCRALYLERKERL